MIQPLERSLIVKSSPQSNDLWDGFKSPPYIGPFGSCKELQESNEDEVLISGPAGTGKSRACLQKIHDLAQRWPGSRYLIIRKTRTSLSESALQTFEDWVLGAGHPLILSGPERRNRVKYTYPNGSEIYAGGMDKPGRIMSTEFDLIFCQEAIELDEGDWEALTTRLRNNVLPFQQIMADTNPSFPRHWLKIRCDNGTTNLLESRHEDNPVLYDHDKNEWTKLGKVYLMRLDRLTGARKLRLRDGKWVQAEGVIYEGWDTTIHLIDSFKIPDHWRKFRCVDFGYVNPFVCGWFALDEDDRMYLYRYIYMTKRTVRVHAEKIEELSRDDMTLDPRIVCDHDAEDQATLVENGLETILADKRVSVGIDAVIERLKIQGDGRPRLFVLRDSLVETDQSLVEVKKPYRVEDEFDSYIWKEKSRKEEPLKEDDHGMDMVRYAVMAVDKPEKEPEFQVQQLAVNI